LKLDRACEETHIIKLLNLRDKWTFIHLNKQINFALLKHVICKTFRQLEVLGQIKLITSKESLRKDGWPDNGDRDSKEGKIIILIMKGFHILSE
jgi:hypothetical protein